MKLHLFQQITELNHSFDELIAGLAKLESIPFFQRELIQHARSGVEIARVYANREFFLKGRCKTGHAGSLQNRP